ncbi:urease accessory protein UreD [Limnohabitans sp. JirII-31]|uniref:urease accessory protein UreD n=1 Tax=Limnohabitans sp. JirII-31 TaxID=1977908 RepID=UPI000C1E5310|nr:urease accessory protein UreD [Limnohabitans sp. JirII-31]PIT73513.1 urease accessory protein [Limnohabitans sp. JirII-31]
MTGWHAKLSLAYATSGPRTVVRFEHQGPLRVLQSLYPEGDRVCHNVLVHPPGGLVGGDTLDIQVQLDTHSHGLITTPGATRFYRSENGLATQQVHAQLGEHTRLEWLPLETLAYNGCHGLNQATFDMAPSAELMAWDITALGLPNANLPFEQGQLQQHLEIKGVWLERGLIDAQDLRLLNGPLGLAGQRCMATLVFACGADLNRERRELALSVAREALGEAVPGVQAGVTSPHPRVVVLRTLSPLVEPAQQLLRAVWAAWRKSLWQMGDTPPRIWAM